MNIDGRHLGNSGKGSADEAGVGAEFGLFDRDVRVQLRPKMFVKRFFKRFVKKTGCRTESAADHDAFGIERVHELRDGRAQSAAGSLDGDPSGKIAHAGEGNNFSSVANASSAA